MQVKALNSLGPRESLGLLSQRLPKPLWGPAVGAAAEQSETGNLTTRENLPREACLIPAL